MLITHDYQENRLGAKRAIHKIMESNTKQYTI